MESVTLLKEENGLHLETTLMERLAGVFRKNDRIAVKLHMGESGNRHFVKPVTVRRVIGVLSALNTRPFLFDSPVIYPGSRDSVEKYLQTARAHGFFDVGCEVVISNDSVMEGAIEVCKDIADADGLFVISHVKGHMCTGFAAAIKNLGMGGVSVTSKKRIHIDAQAVPSGDCSLCGTCVEVCPVSAVRIEGEGVIINYNFGCWGCGVCIRECPEQALRPRKASFNRLLAESARAVLSTVNRVYYMNIISDVTALCDCCSDPGRILIDDIGIVLGDDIVAVDAYSLRLINKKAGRDIFREVHRLSPSGHVEEAGGLGCGQM